MIGRRSAVKNLSDLDLAVGDVLFLDRVEAEVATLLLPPEGEREVNVPRDQLPAEAREGDRLRMGEDGRLAVDHDATTASHAAVADLMADLLATPSEAETEAPPTDSRSRTS